jgi:hypothetical protein
MTKLEALPEIWRGAADECQLVLSDEYYLQSEIVDAAFLAAINKLIEDGVAKVIDEPEDPRGHSRHIAFLDGYPSIVIRL